MPFVSGHALSAALYAVVEPVLGGRFADLPVAAALVGRGSDVLGYDTERSADHDWGPRVALLVPDRSLEAVRAPLLTAIEAVLPEQVLGVPVDHRVA